MDRVGMCTGGFSALNTRPEREAKHMVASKLHRSPSIPPHPIPPHPTYLVIEVVEEAHGDEGAVELAGPLCSHLSLHGGPHAWLKEEDAGHADEDCKGWGGGGGGMLVLV